ncbi:putative short-chain dehydrogenase/reductase [Xylariaceae sp. AK1471]|nr:putative short-chain dehydrogenase/reductase [Xylariaceae sp. AK1471]
MLNKTVLITGCSDGSIGPTLAKQFAARGYQVCATVRTVSKAALLTGVSGVEILELEVTSSESISACAAEPFAPMLIKTKGCVANFGSIAGVIPMCCSTRLIYEHADELHLPAESYYQSLRDHTNEVRKGSVKPGAVNPEVVCKEIIDDIIGGKSGPIWRGGI